MCRPYKMYLLHSTSWIEWFFYILLRTTIETGQEIEILPDKGIRSLKICHGIKLWVEQNYQQNVEQQNGLSYHANFNFFWFQVCLYWATNFCRHFVSSVLFVYVFSFTHTLWHHWDAHLMMLQKLLCVTFPQSEL